MNSRTKKILIGVVAVIGGGLLLITAAIIAFVIWVGRPAPMIDTVRLIGSDTVGYATLRLEPGDPETVAFLDRLESAYEDTNANDEVFERFGATSRRDFSFLLPSQAAWTMTPGLEGSADLHLASLSIARVGRWLSLADGIVGWFVGAGQGQTTVERYGDERITAIDTPNVRGAYFLRSGTIFVTSSPAAARNAVDFLSAAEVADAGRTPTALEELFAMTEPSAPLRAAVANPADEFARVLEGIDAGLNEVLNLRFDEVFDSEAFGSPIDLSEVAGITLAGRLTSEGGVDGEAILTARSAPWSDADAQALTAAFGRIEPEDLRGAELQVEVRADGERLEIDFRIPNFVEVVAVAPQRSRGQEPASEPQPPSQPAPQL